ncbi:peptidase domain-containing ABC transporter [uncultured Shewanella sp.]|uniref:peptidase domain-containing ABC transporter n=1 Tax=uncultured Shewanella sp. TaxID=173975 RepID=UPI00260E8C17|nr:peptidase domain-containing ABC transporter [uncultured Shewanella sp.]
MLSFFPKKKCPVIHQSENSECGIACLAMVSHYYGRKTDIASLRRELQYNDNGLSLHTLSEYAQQINLESRALQLEMNELNQLRLPCILHWDLDHFVVLTKVNNKSISIHDPAIGKKVYSLTEASQHFTGVALELFPTIEFKKEEKTNKLSLSAFLSASKGLKSGLFKMLIASLLLQVFSLASPYYMQLVVDDVIVNHDRDLLLLLLAGFTLLTFISTITGIIRELIGLHIQSHLNIQWGAALFNHLSKLPMAWYEKRHLGDIMSRFGAQSEIQSFITSTFVNVILDGLMASTTLIMMYIYSPTLSAIVLSAVLIYALSRYLSYHPFKNNAQEQITASAKEDSFFIEGIKSIQAIKLKGYEDKRKKEWLSLYTNMTNLSIKGSLWSMGFSTFNSLIMTAENLIVVYIAAISVIDGYLSIGMMMAFMAYKGQFSSTISGLIDSLVEFKMLDVHLSRLSDIALEPQEDNRCGIGLPSKIQGKIELQNIGFKYSENSPFLFRNLNITITPGESIAFTGPSGCGKTTLMKIILGLLIPTEGKILLDGTDIKQIGLVAYRQRIASVMQNDTLLSGSIADNISFFDEKIDRKKMKEVARKAFIHDEIEQLPMSYHTLIGDIGSLLSGGQTQRILLARALYQDPAIMVLDEATSNLDLMNESHINAVINELPLTRIIVTHRQSSLESVDKVIDLSQRELNQLKVKSVE